MRLNHLKEILLPEVFDFLDELTLLDMSSSWNHAADPLIPEPSCRQFREKNY
jgi:hypothetical protein